MGYPAHAVSVEVMLLSNVKIGNEVYRKRIIVARAGFCQAGGLRWLLPLRKGFSWCHPSRPGTYLALRATAFLFHWWWCPPVACRFCRSLFFTRPFFTILSTIRLVSLILSNMRCRICSVESGSPAPRNIRRILNCCAVMSQRSSMTFVFSVIQLYVYMRLITDF